MPNGFMGNTSYCCLIDLLFALTRQKEIACVRIFKDYPSWGLKHREIRLDNCKQPLPVNPLGIVAYAFHLCPEMHAMANLAILTKYCHSRVDDDEFGEIS